MADFVSIAEAAELAGLRLLLLRGVPSPWSQAAKGILEIKGVPFQRVCPGEGEGEPEIVAWTKQNAYPAAMYGDERPRSGWAEILLLAERLGSGPALIPADPSERALLFGLAHEICGENGLGWCRRLCALHAGYAAEPANPISLFLGEKYGYSPEAHAQARGRVIDVLRLLDRQLADAKAKGGRYLMGGLTALDVYWATFCNLLAPLPPEQLPLSEALRPMFSEDDPEVLGALSPALLAHRDLVYEQHLVLPVEL